VCGAVAAGKLNQTQSVPAWVQSHGFSVNCDAIAK